MDQKTDPTAPSAEATNSSAKPATPIPQPNIPIPPTPSTSVTPDNKTQGSNKLMIIVFVIVALVLGSILGFSSSYFINSTSQMSRVQVDKDTGEILLPPDAVQIQSCSDRRGKLFVKPADIPVGPVYMVHNDKVIGIEYMLSKDEFLAGKSYNQLSGIDVKVNHVNIGLLSQGHEGYESPHFHVDMYTITSAEADTIVCPKNPNATPTPVATGSAQPSTSTPSAQTASPSATPR